MIGVSPSNAKSLNLFRRFFACRLQSPINQSADHFGSGRYAIKRPAKIVECADHLRRHPHHDRLRFGWRAPHPLLLLDLAHFVALQFPVDFLITR